VTVLCKTITRTWNSSAALAVLPVSPTAEEGTNDQASNDRRGRRRAAFGRGYRAALPGRAAAASWPVVVPEPPPPPVPGPSTTITTVSPTPDGDHRETTIHREVDRKGNIVIEKDVHREGIAGSTDTHTKTETDRDGGTTTTKETTTKPR